MGRVSDVPFDVRRTKNLLALRPQKRSTKIAKNALHKPHKGVSKPFGTREGTQMAPKTTFPRRSHQFWLVLGLPLGPKNRPKTGPEPKKRVRRRRWNRFLRNFRCVAVRKRASERFREGPTFETWPDHHTEFDFKETAFFEKIVKRVLRGPVLGPQIAGNWR